MKIKLSKGLNLPIAGAVDDVTPHFSAVTRAAVVPSDYPGFVPKVEVAPGDAVKAGAALMFDKRHPEVKLVSPVAGKVVAVERGERRKLLKVVVEMSGDEAESFDITWNTPREAVALLANSGLLAMMRTRPYDVVPDPEVLPRDIFVTAIYSAPLELPLSARIKAEDKPLLDMAAEFLAGITTGKVYLSHDSSWTLGGVSGAEMAEFSGPHPVGNAGVQIAAIRPVDKGDTVWTLDIETLRRIGHLLAHRTFDAGAVVGVCGPDRKSVV